MVSHRIVVTGGGTGGHIYPALAVCEQLTKEPDVEAILYIGARGHLEERIAAQRQIEFVGLASAGLPRRPSVKALAWPFKTLYAVLSAQKVLATFRPTAALGTGGYAAAPPLAAALLSSIPFAVHEPDAYPGLVNRLFSRYASVCSLGMQGATGRLKTSGQIIFNGNPLGTSFLCPPSRADACANLQLQPDLKTLLVTGGSQGAKAVNETVREALSLLLSLQPAIQIVHQVGEKNYSEYIASLPPEIRENPRYVARPYFDNLALAYSVCDLTLCRAGAMTIAELGVIGVPAIFVPYPFAAQDHQTKNARSVETTGAATVIPQTELSADRLFAVVRDTLLDQTKLEKMQTAMKAQGKPNAAHDLAQQLIQLSTKFQSSANQRNR